MAFAIVTASYREQDKVRPPLERTLLTGLTCGGVAVFFAVVGILELFDKRWIIADELTLGQTVLLIVGLSSGIYVAFRTTARTLPAIIAQGLGAGAIAGACVALLVVVMSYVQLRFIFVALSPALLKILSLDLGTWGGCAALVGGGAALGLLGALLYVTPRTLRQPIVVGLSAAGFVGLFQELIQLMMQHEGMVSRVRELLFNWDGLEPQAAAGIAVGFATINFLWRMNRERMRAHFHALPATQQKAARGLGIGLGLLVLLIFPMLAGNFIGQVLMLIGLYVLMGMGLNLELGLAGLLDLGFVAFFAVGAYATALLTADSKYALLHLSYWQAMPVAVALSLVVGVLFGVPVLRVRGDYLAVATLGLGEIVRVLVLSDMAAPLLGGAQGVLNIPRPAIAGYHLDDPVSLFYLTLACSAVAAYFAWRLENSRLGRAWTAIRDDEDVAQALGINLVNVKLLAYGLGATFAGLAGSIFAVMLGSIFPHSFQLLISINVLALIIVGGMGSLPGVVVGAAALIGLPELLREFGEFRFLFYGLTIVVMMRLRPAGLWPSTARQREMRGTDEALVVTEVELSGPATAEVRRPS